MRRGSARSGRRRAQGHRGRRTGQELQYLDQQAAYGSSRAVLDKPEPSVVTPVLPPSYTWCGRRDPGEVAALGAQFENAPGVRDVTYASEALRNLEDLTSSVRTGLITTAVALLLVAVLLILNTISTAMASRRREIEVMKLVGATNWFIRVPFMFEGMFHGVIGAALAVGGMVGANEIIFPRVRKNDILLYFQVTSSQVFSTSIIVLALGCLVGVIGSLWAVSRYLDV
jgi:cell division transport system permease protein